MNIITLFKEHEIHLELLGEPNNENIYNIKFINVYTNQVIHNTNIKINHWYKLPIKEDDKTDYKIEMSLNDNIIFERKKSDKFNKVYVNIGSSSIGDITAWLAQINRYGELHNSKMIVYSRITDIFKNVYGNIEFTNISNPDYINDVDKKFLIDYGPKFYMVDNEYNEDKWYLLNEKYTNTKILRHANTLPVAKICTEIMGIDYLETKPKVYLEDKKPSIKGKYVVIAMQSTSQMKYWNNPYGWEGVSKFLKDKGYKILIIDKHKSFGTHGHFNSFPYDKHVINKTGDIPLSDRLNDIKHADFFIGLSSGLAWLSWAVGTPVIMISGFTKPENEFRNGCIRLHNKNVCNSCFNEESFDFKNKDWMNCPKDKDFICSKSITHNTVIKAIKYLIKN